MVEAPRFCLDLRNISAHCRVDLSDYSSHVLCETFYPRLDLVDLCDEPRSHPRSRRDCILGARCLFWNMRLHYRLDRVAPHFEYFSANRGGTLFLRVRCPGSGLAVAQEPGSLLHDAHHRLFRSLQGDRPFMAFCDRGRGWTGKHSPPCVDDLC